MPPRLISNGSRRRRFSRPTARDLANADLFMTDLLAGDGAPVASRGYGNGAGGGGVVARPPLFDDGPDDHWTVVARAGSAARWLALRDDDLIVRRPPGDPRAWRCFPAGT